MPNTDQGRPLTPRESHVRSYGQNEPRPIRFEHGTTTGYFAAHCRCSACDIVGYRWNKQYGIDRARGLRRLVDATGSRRRIEALACIGWSNTHIARELGMGHTGLGRLAAGVNPTVRLVTAIRIAEVYDRLSGTEGPSKWARAHARNQGWPPPLAWDDDTIDDPAAEPWAEMPVDIDERAVERAMSGDRVALTRAERDQVIRLLAARGHDDADIARRLHMNHSAVGQYRKRHGIAPGVPSNRHTDQEVAS